MKNADSKKILLSHGSGGRMMHNLINDLLLKKLDNPVLRELSDSAFINYKEKLAFSTDSFVVNPIKFPGGDIGKLAVCGTVNDLVMLGAVPQYLSLGLIIEEGFDYRLLEEIIDSISFHTKKARAYVVTGDTKVVERGAVDKLFINTSGIGRIIKDRELSVRNIEPSDKVILTGNIAQHGLAVLAKRKELDLGFDIKSDCASLADLILPVLKKTNEIKFMRDPTRGGVATTLNEITRAGKFDIIIDEERIPVSSKARAACELLGIEPLFIANEGVAVLVVKKSGSERILKFLRRHPLGRNAREIGEVVRPAAGGSVILNTASGAQRIVDMLTGDPLPRIC